MTLCFCCLQLGKKDRDIYSLSPVKGLYGSRSRIDQLYEPRNGNVGKKIGTISARGNRPVTPSPANARKTSTSPSNGRKTSLYAPSPSNGRKTSVYTQSPSNGRKTSRAPVQRRADRYNSQSEISDVYVDIDGHAAIDKASMNGTVRSQKSYRSTNSSDSGYEATKERKKSKEKSKKMKPRDKERLARNRGMIVRTLDVSLIMEEMRRQKVFSSSDEASIMNDPRRRQRAARFLDILEQKKSQAYDIFLETLEEHYPQIYLHLIDWEDDDGANALADDEWTAVRKMRRILIDEIDAKQLVGPLEAKDVLTSSEVADIMQSDNLSEKNETFLDIMETKSSSAYEIFLEVLGEVAPHLYLMLTDHDHDDDDDLDGLYG